MLLLQLTLSDRDIHTYVILVSTSNDDNMKGAKRDCNNLYNMSAGMAKAHMFKSWAADQASITCNF